MKKYTVVKDLALDVTGGLSTVGVEVDTVVLLPSAQVIFLNGPQGVQEAFTTGEVYLCVSPESRFRYNGEKVPVEISTTLGGVTYRGNELYAAEELGV